MKALTVANLIARELKARGLPLTVQAFTEGDHLAHRDGSVQITENVSVIVPTYGRTLRVVQHDNPLAQNPIRVGPSGPSGPSTTALMTEICSACGIAPPKKPCPQKLNTSTYFSFRP